MYFGRNLAKSESDTNHESAEESRVLALSSIDSRRLVSIVIVKAVGIAAHDKHVMASTWIGRISGGEWRYGGGASERGRG
jgi:hypothetical protein